LTVLVSNQATFLDQALQVAAARMPGSICTKPRYIAAEKFEPLEVLV
jgi:hypothetical protein